MSISTPPTTSSAVSTPATSISSPSTSNSKSPPLAGTLRYLALPSKPSSKLAYIYKHVTQNGWISFSLDNPRLYKPHLLIVFVNGAVHTMSSFTLAINRFISSLTLVASVRISILAYDRYSTGLSTDPNPMGPEPTHQPNADSMTHAVRDLRELIHEILAIHHGSASQQPSSPSNATTPSSPGRSSSPSRQQGTHSLPSLLLVGHGVGASISRLFASTYPGTVSGFLFLDSAPTDADMASLLPSVDSSSPTFSSSSSTSPSVFTSEAFQFSTGAPILPFNRPIIPKPSQSPDGLPPFVQVVAQHEWAAFIDEHDCEHVYGRDLLRQIQSAYHAQLRGLTNPERWGGIVEARGVRDGHAVQMDRSDLVGALLKKLVERWLDSGYVQRVGGLVTI